MKFRVTIEGSNFLVALEGGEPGKHGFYVTAHVEALTEDEAEKAATDLLRAHDALRRQVRNPGEDRPRLRVEKIACIADWPENVTRPLTGFAWFAEEKA